MPTLLPSEQFSQALEALPLVSIDLVLTNAQDQVLLGLRCNAPARGWWFTPGGRVRKNEALPDAKRRVARDELGLPEQALQRAQLMGAWDHFYPDSAFSPSVSTHYVNLPLWLELTPQEAAGLALASGPGEQHAQWQWMALAQAAQDEGVHPYVRAYAAWLRSAREVGGALNA